MKGLLTSWIVDIQAVCGQQTKVWRWWLDLQSSEVTRDAQLGLSQ